MERMDIPGHGQYLFDLAEVVKDVAGHDPNRADRLSLHLAHAECAECEAHVASGSFPEIERRFMELFAGEWNRWGGDNLEVLGYIYDWLYERQSYAQREEAARRQGPPDYQKEFVLKLKRLGRVLPWYRRYLVRLAFLGFSYEPRKD